MGLFWAKYARRIFAIVSTTSIPNLAPASPTEATVDPPSRGSRLDADHPENGVLIPCRFTVDRGLFWEGLVGVGREEERGPAYAHYLRSVANNPDFVGAHWFQYVDEPLTGRTLD